MDNYMHRPIAVKAFQLGVDDPPDWFDKSVIRHIPFDESRAKNYGQAFCEIETLDGKVMATERNYIVRDVDNNLCVYKADVFEGDFEKIYPEDESEFKIPESKLTVRNLIRQLQNVEDLDETVYADWIITGTDSFYRNVVRSYNGWKKYGKATGVSIHEHLENEYIANGAHIQIR